MLFCTDENMCKIGVHLAHWEQSRSFLPSGPVWWSLCSAESWKVHSSCEKTREKFAEINKLVKVLANEWITEETIWRSSTILARKPSKETRNEWTIWLTAETMRPCTASLACARDTQRTTSGASSRTEPAQSKIKKNKGNEHLRSERKERQLQRRKQQRKIQTVWICSGVLRWEAVFRIACTSLVMLTWKTQAEGENNVLSRNM